MPGLLLLLSLFGYQAAFSVSVPNDAAESRQPVGHKAYPLDFLDDILTQDGVEIDTNIFTEGGGSLKIQSESV